MNDDVFEEAVKRIQTAYTTLEFQPKNDWRFLYSPKSTLAPSTKLMLLAFNPRLESRLPPDFSRESVEQGNAYVVEPWEGRTARNVQSETRYLFDHIANGLKIVASRDELLNRTLTSNLCPFGSRAWREDLGKEETVREFCRELWGYICAYLEPAVVICLGRDPYKEFKDLFASTLDGTLEIESSVRTGFGSTKYELAEFSRDSANLLIVKIPLFAPGSCIMSKTDDKYARPRNIVINKIVQQLNQADNRWLQS